MADMSENLYILRMDQRSLHPETARVYIRTPAAQNSPVGGITKSGSSPKVAGSWPEGTRTLGQYALVYVYAGSGRYEDGNGLDLPVNAGDLILLFPDLPHRYGPGDAGWSEYYLVFEGPAFDLWRDAGVISQECPIHHLQPVDYWLRRFESVLGAPAGPGLSPPLLEVARLQLVLAEAISGGPRGKLRQDQVKWASRACALVEADLSKTPDMHHIAEQMGVTYATFRRQFRQLVGLPPAKYRAKRAIDRACELMQQTDLSDKQIAAELGFCDDAHFSKRFRQLTGQSPRSFRRHRL